MVKTSIRSFLYFSLFLLLFPGCSPILSPAVMKKVDTTLTFKKVIQDPDACIGKTVFWGGEIIQVLPQDGTTVIEILQMPLGWRGRPGEASASEGKFLVLFREYFDFSHFNKGRKITMAGEIQRIVRGDEIESLSEKNYRYPLLLIEEIHLWKEYVYPYSSPPPYVSPWWNESPDRRLPF
jgi:outer membrane lipoprotein